MSNIKIYCSFCELKFEYNEVCLNCLRDREGLTQEDRMKPVKRKDMANPILMDIMNDRRRKQRKNKKIKWDNNPFPGKSSKIKIVR